MRDSYRSRVTQRIPDRRELLLTNCSPRLTSADPGRSYQRRKMSDIPETEIESALKETQYLLGRWEFSISSTDLLLSLIHI